MDFLCPRDPSRIARTARELAPAAEVVCLQAIARGFDTLPGNSADDRFELLVAEFPGRTAIEGVAVDVPDGRGGRRQFRNLLRSRLLVRQASRRFLLGAHRCALPCD